MDGLMKDRDDEIARLQMKLDELERRVSEHQKDLQRKLRWEPMLRDLWIAYDGTKPVGWVADLHGQSYEFRILKTAGNRSTFADAVSAVDKYWSIDSIEKDR